MNEVKETEEGFEEEESETITIHISSGGSVFLETELSLPEVNFWLDYLKSEIMNDVSTRSSK